MTPEEQVEHLKVLLSNHLQQIDERVTDARERMNKETDMEAKRMYLEYMTELEKLRHNVTMQYTNTRMAISAKYGI